MSCLNRKQLSNCLNRKQIFSEVINHSRRKNTARNAVSEIDIHKYKDYNFSEIYTEIYNIFSTIDGLGNLAVYDTTSAICKYHNKNIDKVYIIGNGPKLAIKKLDLQDKVNKQVVGLDSNEKPITINYIEINDILKAFPNNGYDLPNLIDKNCIDGDFIESNICI